MIDKFDKCVKYTTNLQCTSTYIRHYVVYRIQYNFLDNDITALYSNHLNSRFYHSMNSKAFYFTVVDGK